MILQLMFDLHSDCADFGGYPKPVSGVDMVFVAGDTRQGIAPALAELRRAYPRPVEIVAVAGNHEFWRRTWAHEIEEEKSHEAPTAVITHFPATPHAIDQLFQRSISMVAACSDLTPPIERHQPELWLSGHTHVRTSSRIGKTHLVSTPSDYPDEKIGFDRMSAIEIVS